MAMANMPFRGHREKIGKINSGNFLAIIELLALYDPLLKELLELPEGTAKYLSPRIQNELIEILSTKVKSEILSQVNEAHFYSLIMDTTQDVSKTDQMSQVIRYVSVERNANMRATKVRIHEAFLGFQAIHDQRAAGIEKEILECIDSNGLSIHKCRGQGYDGAATMSGIYSGVQARILEKEHNAMYVHCAAHNLNLVLQDAVSEITEISNFSDILQHVYTFFGESIRRWELLSSFTSSSSVTLKKLCPTRWSSRHESLLALRFRFSDVMMALSKIILISSKKTEINEAMALKKKMDSFQFVFLVVLQTKVLQTVNALSTMLQAESMDLSKATNLIKNAAEELSQFRNHFDEAKESAILLARSWGISPAFESKRLSKVKKHFDELSTDERLHIPEDRFKVTVFYEYLDIIVGQLSNRFNGMNRVVQYFRILQPADLASSSDEELYEAALQLQKKYNQDLSPAFPAQLLSFRCALKNDIQKLTSVKDLAHLLLVENSLLSSNLPDVCIVLLLFLTLPVTVASAERSFSKLKQIKNYLRSTMSEHRLSGLAILSIENARANQLDIDGIVDQFAEAKARRRQF
ncbi:zinc finger MYM-type protein 1-like [Ranitomeya variabilis]|uniref:zinc finger MYM-type protein 1-like n=1 Tax=Ranitomeya variabilis TaxID=490064 RepID=UPI004057173F